MTDHHPHWLLTAFLPEEEQAELRAMAAGRPEAEAEIADSERLRERLDRGLELDRTEAVELLAVLVETSGSVRPGWQERLRDRIQAAVHQEELRRLDPPGAAEAQFNSLSGGTPRRRRRALPVAAALALLILAQGAFSSWQSRDMHAVWELHRLEGPTRGSSQSPLERARGLIRDSRSTTLGLWPRYDEDLLLSAEAQIRDLTGEQIRLERARIKVLLGRREQAAQILRGIPAERLPAALQAAIAPAS
ncbi:MAG: hypothetical protein JJ896_03990 [Rhodothermales bacterium]|nr:hypothetical protein [Rhodothermales bacterium]MBO6778797.1 hypothetical protein [Rhodothermales bacterium]